MAINTIKLGDGPQTLVLLHGFAAGVGFWQSNLAELAREYTVYAIDLPGFGRSSRGTFDGTTPDDAERFFLEPLREWFEHEHADRPVHLLGHSFGAYLSAVFALRHPERVRSLTLADPWGVPRKRPEDEIDWSRMSLPRRLLWRTIVAQGASLAPMRAAGPLGPSLIRRVRGDLGAKFAHAFGEQQATTTVCDYVYACNAQSPATGELAFDALTAGFGWAARPLEGRLEQLSPRIPCTLFYGSHTWLDSRAGRRIAARAPDRFRVETIDGAGHHVYVDQYDEFNDLVLRTLRHADRLLSKRSASTSSTSSTTTAPPSALADVATARTVAAQ